MELVLLTALGVGGATVIGAVIGFLFKNISWNSFLNLNIIAENGITV